MKNFNLRYKDSEGNEKEVAMRLTSSACEQIEKDYNCTLLDYVQQGSVTSLVTMLRYMREGAGEKITRNMANDFYDELVDAGYTIERILMEIIYEVLVVSGVISQEDFNSIKDQKEKIKNMTDEEKRELVEQRKNVKK